MPKQAVTVDRIKISCEVVPDALGLVMVALTKMGLTNINYELITDVHTFRQKGGANGQSATEILKAWIVDHATFKTREAGDHLEQNGFARSSAYAALKALTDEGVLKKLAGPNYSRSDVQAIAGPKKEKGPTPKKFKKSGADAILSFGKTNHGTFSTAQLVKLFAKQGRARNSVYASVNELLTKKLVKRVGEEGSGKYVLLRSAAKAKSVKKAAAKLNGSAPAEVSAHG